MNLVIHASSNQIALHLENMGVKGALRVANNFRGGTKDNINSLMNEIKEKDLGKDSTIDQVQFRQTVARELDVIVLKLLHFNTPIITQSL